MSDSFPDRPDRTMNSDSSIDENIDQESFSTTLASSSKIEDPSPESMATLPNSAMIASQNPQVERTFHPFPKLPPELRLKIWKYAITSIRPRIICLQPTYNDHLAGPMQACWESREEAKKTFSICKSRQRTLPFTVFINYNRDVIYLNRKFANPAKDCYPSPLHGAIHFYSDVMKEIKFLAMNIKDLNNLTTAYRGGKFDLWEMLHENCPRLMVLIIVIDGPVRGNARDKIEFRRLYMASDVDHDEFRLRHNKLMQVMISLVRAKKKKALWKEPVIHVASIDQTKELPIKDGEREVTMAGELMMRMD